MISRTALVVFSMLRAINYHYLKGHVIVDNITIKKYTEKYFSLLFYSKNCKGEWLRLILLLVIIQWKLRGWVINIDSIIIFVRWKNETYIFWYCILNVWLLFWSTLCHLMEQIRSKQVISWKFDFGFFLFYLFILCSCSWKS